MMGIWEYRSHKYGVQYARREPRRCHTERNIRERSLGIVNTERDIHEGSRGAVRTIVHAGGHGIVNVYMKRVKALS